MLGGRERVDACETLLLRARADLDGGREREAALQLRVGLEALLVELRAPSPIPATRRTWRCWSERRGEAGEAANAALRGDLTPSSRTRSASCCDLRARAAPPPGPRGG